MAYDVNTSKTCRLPHDFFWDWYSTIPDLEDMVNDLSNGQDSFSQKDTLEVLEFTLAQLKRMRQSHRGCEDL